MDELRIVILFFQLIVAACFAGEALQPLAPAHEYWVLGGTLVCALLILAIKPLRAIGYIASTLFWTWAAFQGAGGIAAVSSGASVLAAVVVFCFAAAVNSSSPKECLHSTPDAPRGAVQKQP